MPMEKKGLVKLVEECGELIQIAAKKMATMESDEHWDSKGSMKKRLEEEIADVSAATAFVAIKFDLDLEYIYNRIDEKILKFQKWDKEQN